jgi:hypothetical protein
LETINFAYDYALTNKLFDNENLEEYLVAHLELVGFTKRNDNIENYCQSIARHFIFNNNYFSDDRPIHINKKQHPTWNLEVDETKYKFGGILQNDDKNPLFI